MTDEIARYGIKPSPRSELSIIQYTTGEVSISYVDKKGAKRMYARGADATDSVQQISRRYADGSSLLITKDFDGSPVFNYRAADGVSYRLDNSDRQRSPKETIAALKRECEEAKDLNKPLQLQVAAHEATIEDQRVRISELEELLNMNPFLKRKSARTENKSSTFSPFVSNSISQFDAFFGGPAGPFSFGSSSGADFGVSISSVTAPWLAATGSSSSSSSSSILSSNTSSSSSSSSGLGAPSLSASSSSSSSSSSLSLSASRLSARRR